MTPERKSNGENGAGLRLLELRLRRERPRPAPSFRGRLGREVEAQARWIPSRATMRRLALVCLLAGLALLSLAALSLAGAGPLG